MDTFLVAIIGMSEVISLPCLYRLWKGRDKALMKIIWSLILIVPVLGPVFYGGMHNPPPPQPDDLRAPFSGETFWEDTHAHKHEGYDDHHDCD